MALWLYNLGLLLSTPVIVAILLAKARCRPGLPYRMGFRLPALPAACAADAPVIWVHAVSLGEVVAVAPLVLALHREDPRRTIVVSTVTETGREAVLQRLAGIATHCYAPLDFPWVVRRVVRALNPALYIFVETELWPNLLTQLARAQVPTVLVNGRLSSRSFRRQQWPGVHGLYRGLVSGLTCCLMQSERDVERVVRLGAKPERVRRIGNIKFDQPRPSPAAESMAAIHRWLAAREGRPVLVAGSTHPGEEEMVVEAALALRRQRLDLQLVIAPRHIERSSALTQMLAGHDIPWVLRSRLEQTAHDPSAWVVVLDSRGELGAVYQQATVAFVGGTLVPIGGHNLLEPAAWGKPVVFGPYTDHCQEIAELLERAGAGIRVADQAGLTEVVHQWLTHPSRRDEAGRQAEQVVRENQGALEQCLSVIRTLLRETDSRDQAAPGQVGGASLQGDLR